MSETERRFHETWLGMVQPVDGLVVSVPVLVEHQCMRHAPPEAQVRLRELCASSLTADHKPVVTDLDDLLRDILELTPVDFDRGDALPQDLSLYVPEGKQTLRPTLALRHFSPPPEPATPDPEQTPAARAGRRYVALIWDLAAGDASRLGLPLDKPEDRTGPWHYPPAAKFERLLRQCRVPIGILTNRRVIRLVYAPHGESAGAITFRVDDMLAVGGRPVLDAFVMLLHRNRWFGVSEDHALPALLAESRKRQAEVTNALADQVFEALEILLHGFEAAAERDRDDALREALAEPGDRVYAGLLTVLLRLVFMLFAEDRGLLPVDHPVYAEHYSVLGLFEQLQTDAAAHPDAMTRRFGAWSRLVAAWRAIFLGVHHGDLHMPPREGEFFDPNTHPFLEGRSAGGSAPLHFQQHNERAAVRVPSVDDDTVHRVLDRLLYLERQRLSYRALDVEQIGSVYEALMGYHVVRLHGRAACFKPQRAKKVWISATEVLEIPKAQRAAWLQDEMGLAKQTASRLAESLEKAKSEDDAIAAMSALRIKHSEVLTPGRLVLQPGQERRRTSSHYTPRSLTEPIVRRTLEPVLAAMGPEPASQRLLSLKICDPAMGSGAFLVEVVRFLGDQVVAAWTREGDLPRIADAHEDVVMHARRLVAQRCVYGVDKNRFAVDLAKLSLWLVTLARDLPFTFVDHALRHGDSLVGLSLDQLRAFHWEPGPQLELVELEIRRALDESVSLRQQICDLAESQDGVSHRERSRLLRDAEDAASTIRLLGDLIIGAFFAHEKPKEREQERKRRLDLVKLWLLSKQQPPAELLQLQEAIRDKLPTFHWPLEFPEIFFAEREDPLEDGKANKAAAMDAFVGNPPFLGSRQISETRGERYHRWLLASTTEAHGNADYIAYFFRRSHGLLGAHGVANYLATGAISESDTRRTAFAKPLSAGAVIYDATTPQPWPGEAAVRYVRVGLAQGRAAVAIEGQCRLDGSIVPSISSELYAEKERREPERLCANSELAFIGCKILGQGFLLSEVEAETLCSSHEHRVVVWTYLVGDDLNNDPECKARRKIINFGGRTLEQAERFALAMGIVRHRVKPDRELGGDHALGRHGKKYWWQFGSRVESLHKAIEHLPRCICVARVSKHATFTFSTRDNVFSEQVIVVATDSTSTLATLQSRIHYVWANRRSTSHGDGIRYSHTDCFETFPFQTGDPRVVLPELAVIGEALCIHRAAYMLRTQQGLTKTYNALKDPECHDAEIVALRDLHIELDRAVLNAYGWADIKVPSYTTPRTPAERAAFEAFEDAVLDRLFALNAERVAEEERLGLRKKGKAPAAAAKPARGKTTTRTKPTTQLALGEKPDPDSDA